VIDRLAKFGDAHVVKFPPAQIKGRDRAARDGLAPETTYDFSFSGIKTAVLRYVETHRMKEEIEARRQKLATASNSGAPSLDEIKAACSKQTLDLVASFQRTVVEDLVRKTLHAADEIAARTLFITGGVAANSELRTRFEHECNENGVPVYFP